MLDREEIKRQMKIAIENSNSMASASRMLGINFKTFKKYAKEFGLYKPNQGLKGGFKSKINIEDVLSNKVGMSSSNLKKRLLREGYLEERCYSEKCYIKNTWCGASINLELDHIDGNNKNNNLINLRLLCPNCHSQTETYRGKNIKKTKKYTDDDFINAFNNSINVSQICEKLGIVKKGGNFKTVKDKMKKMGLEFKVINIPNIENECKCGKIISYKSKKCRECYRLEKSKNKKKPNPNYRHEPKFSQRKVERPSYEVLKKEIEETSYCAVGRKYGVSDNAVRKWLKFYEKNKNK
jgi:hypothetical protein